MDKVSVNTSSRTTMVLEFDLPEDLRRTLLDYARRESAVNLPDEIIVMVGGVRVGKVNPFARHWQSLDINY
jgi:hypothetical protein